MGIALHQDLIEKNHRLWGLKPILQKCYFEFHQMMAEYLSRLAEEKVVELGSGMGNIHEVIPECIRTDLFPYPWIDQVENAYTLTFTDNSISDILMVDVFHHIRYPGSAIKEFHRVLRTGGRVIMMEPCISFLGYIVFGLFHPEPVSATGKMEWFAPANWNPKEIDYYASQGNATQIFVRGHFASELSDWRVVKVRRIAALAYVASGGYSGPQLYPNFAYPFVKFLENFLHSFPDLFATRLLIVLEKI